MQEPIALLTFLIIGLTILVSYFGFRSDAVEEKYIFNPERILAGKEFHRLITSAFLHADWWHLLLNMVSLYFFGPAIELTFGKANLLVIYCGSVLGGNLVSLYVHRHHDYRAYGASGGVCGVIFASILLFPGMRLSAFPLPYPIPTWLWVIGFVLASFYGMKANNKGNIGHDAHL